MFFMTGNKLGWSYRVGSDGDKDNPDLAINRGHRNLQCIKPTYSNKDQFILATVFVKLIAGMHKLGGLKPNNNLIIGVAGHSFSLKLNGLWSLWKQ